MSIDAPTIQILLDAGMGGKEIYNVAKAMERGPDQNVVYTLIDNLEAVSCPRKAIAIAIVEVCEKIIEANERGYARQFRDVYTVKRDSNKARRGLSNQRWQQLRVQTFERDGWACVYCGADDDLTCDHVIPLIRGGTNDNDNLATACRSCNSSKGDKLLGEWGRA